MVERLGNTTKKVEDLAFVDVTGRVARTLLDLCNEPDAMTHSDGMQIKAPRQEIGRIIGCSLEMVGRVLKTLQEQGHVSVKGKTMIVYRTPLVHLPNSPEPDQDVKQTTYATSENSSASFSPGSFARMKASPTRKLLIPRDLMAPTSDLV